MNTRSKFGFLLAAILMAASMLFSFGVAQASIEDRVINQNEVAIEPIIFVDDNFTETTPGWGVDHFAEIQPAVEAVEVGGTIQVAPGTYNGQIVIDKDLSLLGSNKDSIINATSSMLENFTTSTPNWPIVYITDTTNVTIQGFTIDGLGLGNLYYRYIGIGFHNAGGSVIDNAIVNITETPFSGSQHGVAIYVYNEDTVQRSITVNRNTITDFQKNAMALNSADNTPLLVDVQNNIITGIGITPITAQNGIQVKSLLGSGIISGNTITGIGYDNTNSTIKWVGSSILNFYADLQVSGNTINNAQEGIYFIDANGKIDGNELSIVMGGITGNGINVADPPNAIPSPIDLPAHDVNNTISGLQSTVSVEISNNNIVYPEFYNNLGSIGIQADAGYGMKDLDITIHDNQINSFSKGLVIALCDPIQEPGVCTSSVYQSISVIRNNFAENSLAIMFLASTLGITPEIHFNRFYRMSEGGGILSFLSSPVNAQNNWWGCNEGPMLPGPYFRCMYIDNMAETVIYRPWLIFTMEPSMEVYVGETVAVSANTLLNSNFEDITEFGSIPDGVTARFFADGGVLNPPLVSTLEGMLTTNFTAPTTSGNYHISTFLDGAEAITVVTVLPNDIPIAHSQTIEMDEDTQANILLNATDSYPGALSWLVELPQHGILSGTAPDLIYTPETDWNGEDSFTFTVDDGIETSNTATVTITVAAVNDPPVAITIDDIQWLAREPHYFTFPAFTDVDLDNLTYTASLADGSALPSWLGFDEQTLTFSGSPTNREVGEYQIKLTASDGVAEGSTIFTLKVVLNPYTYYLPVVHN